MLTGLSYLCGATLTEGATDTYSAGTEIAQLTEADFKLSYTEAKFYANNKLRKDKKVFKEGSITFGIDDLSQTQRKFLTGGTEEAAGIEGDATTKKLISAIDDDGGFKGVGFCARKETDAEQYRAIWLYKVKFNPPDESFKGEEGEFAFAKETITGTIYANSAENWKEEVTVATLAGAIAWLNAHAGIAAGGGT